jgi:hypothetical protein
MTHSPMARFHTMFECCLDSARCWNKMDYLGIVLLIYGAMFPSFHCPGPPGHVSALSVFHSKSICMGLLYGRAGRLTAENGGFRPGQFCSTATQRGSGATSA